MELTAFGNGLAPAIPQQGTSQMAAVAREAQEVQAAVFMARQFPRNCGQALSNIEADCTRVRLAEQAVYEYPRGGQTVSGPSIRLAEVISQRWGNMDCGWKVTDSTRPGESTCMAWAWDLETNMRKRIEFVVQHIRDTKKETKILTDQRDIYELVANQSQRRLRNCILAIIPGDVVEAAINACESTLANKGNIETKRKEIVDLFKKMDVEVEAIEKRLGKKISAMSSVQYVGLVKIHSSMRDGMSKKSDWFEDILNPEKIAQASADAAKPGAADLPHEAKAKSEAELNESNIAIGDFLDTANHFEDLGGDLAATLKMKTDQIVKLPIARIRAATSLLKTAIDNARKQK